MAFYEASEYSSLQTRESQSAIISKEPCLFISTITWARDSHELFDYETRHVVKQSYFLKHTSRVFRRTLDVQIVPDGCPLPPEAVDYLLSIRYRDGRYIVMPADRNTQGMESLSLISPKKVWLIVKNLPTRSHHLREGDIIKLGRFKLRVKQLVREGSNEHELKLENVKVSYSDISPEEWAGAQCRICLMEEKTESDPLLCPCQCKGSIKFVHLECLRHWVNGKISFANEDRQHGVSFFLNLLQCELCKTFFPTFLKMNDKEYSIVKLPKMKAPFMILENFVGTANCGLHVISMNKKKVLRLGRGHESDVRISDVSISRYHATIRFANNEFVLEDHNSKFGTLISLRKVHVIKPSSTLAVQVGRTILNISLRLPPPLFFTHLLRVNENSVFPGTGQDDFLGVYSYHVDQNCGNTIEHQSLVSCNTEAAVVPTTSLTSGLYNSDMNNSCVTRNPQATSPLSIPALSTPPSSVVLSSSISPQLFSMSFVMQPHLLQTVQSLSHSTDESVQMISSNVYDCECLPSANMSAVCSQYPANSGGALYLQLTSQRDIHTPAFEVGAFTGNSDLSFELNQHVSEHTGNSGIINGSCSQQVLGENRTTFLSGIDQPIRQINQNHTHDMVDTHKSEDITSLTSPFCIGRQSYDYYAPDVKMQCSSLNTNTMLQSAARHETSDSSATGFHTNDHVLSSPIPLTNYIPKSCISLNNTYSELSMNNTKVLTDAELHYHSSKLYNNNNNNNNNNINNNKNNRSDDQAILATNSSSQTCEYGTNMFYTMQYEQISNDLSLPPHHN